MKYVSLDIETTGLDAHQDQILQIAMVVEDTFKPETPVEELPSFVALLNHNYFRGNAFALAMNAWILSAIASGKSEYPIYNVHEYPQQTFEPGEISGPSFNYPMWIQNILTFLDAHFGEGTRVTLAGKNVAGFDLQFLPQEIKNRVRHRVLDVGPLFVDFSKDAVVPDLKECMKRAYPDKVYEVSHDALEDARDVIRLLRTRYT